MVKDVEIETDTVLWFHTYAPHCLETLLGSKLFENML